MIMCISICLCNGVFVCVFVTYSKDDDKNDLHKMSILDSNLSSNDSAEVWIVTKLQQYYNFTIVINVGRCSLCKLSFRT